MTPSSTTSPTARVADTRFRPLRSGPDRAVLAWDTSTVPNGRYVRSASRPRTRPPTRRPWRSRARERAVPSRSTTRRRRSPRLSIARHPPGCHAVARDDSSLMRRPECSIDARALGRDPSRGRHQRLARGDLRARACSGSHGAGAAHPGHPCVRPARQRRHRPGRDPLEAVRERPPRARRGARRPAPAAADDRGAPPAGHGVSLLAPAVPARSCSGLALRGRRGPRLGRTRASPVSSPETTTSGPVAARSAGRRRGLLQPQRSARRGLAARARRVIRQDPSPRADGTHAAEWLTQAVAPAARRMPRPTAGRRCPRAHRRGAPARADRDPGLPEGFLAVHPGSGSPAKNWPCDALRRCSRAGSAAAKVAARRGSRGARTSTAPCRRRARAATAAAAPGGGARTRRCSSWATTPASSHLAAAVGAPTLALFGPTDPALWAPVGRRVRPLHAPGTADARRVCEAGDACCGTAARTPLRSSGERTSAG